MIFLTSNEVLDILNSSLGGKNSHFLAASHNLWTRFKNYDRNPPMALVKNDRKVSIIFATFNKNFYANLYEIVTVQGHEGKGYASQLWEQFTHYAVEKQGMKRLKISCTPSSITWHLRNGLIFWGVDSLGSLKSDQPLFPDRATQLDMRNLFVNSPEMALPSEKVIKALKESQLNSYSFSDSKKKLIQEAIEKVGKYWLGDYLQR